MTDKVINPNLKILDCTLRDGSYAAKFSEAEIKDICLALDSSGLEYIEVGNGLGLGYHRKKTEDDLIEDKIHIETAKANIKNAKIGVFFIPNIGTMDDLKEAAAAGIDFVRIGNNATNYKEAIPYIDYAKKLGLEVSFNFMKSYVLSPFEFLKASQEVAKTNLDMIYLVDSAGGMFPRQVADYIRLLSENIDTCKIGFHGHNNLMLVNANNIEAINNGAALVDTTLMGLGRGGGNSQTEIMLYIFERMGLEHGIDNKIILEAGKKYIVDKMAGPRNAYDIDVVSGFAMFHSSFFTMFSKVAEEKGVDVRDLIIRVCNIDQENPNLDLINEVAGEILSNKTSVYSPRSIKDASKQRGKVGQGGH